MGNVRMSRLRAFAARVLELFGPRKRDSDFDEEVQAHLQLLADRFVAQGMQRRTPTRRRDVSSGMPRCGRKTGGNCGLWYR